MLPLWNPYLFTGVPFLANPQAGVLYAPNWPLSWLNAPRAVALSYLAHLWIAGAGLYCLLRWSAGCRPPAGFLGASVFSLGGVFAAQAGHINQVQAAAWLPWLVLAFQKGRLPWTVVGACFYGLGFLAGHPQQTFISSGALALTAAWDVLQRLLSTLLRPARFRRPEPAGDVPAEKSLIRTVALIPVAAGLRLAVIVAGGLGLAGAQLLPALELSSFSVRSGGLGYGSAVSFSLPPPESLRALFPTYGEQASTEFIAYTGVVALVLAWWGFWRGRRPWTVYLFAAMVAAGLFLALGRFNPLYPLLHAHAPGFDLFRAPARWLLLYAFGVAGLAGIGLQAVLCRGAGPAGISRTLLALAAPVALAAAAYLAVRISAPLTVPPPPIPALWVSTAFVALLAVVVAHLAATRLRWAAGACVALLVAGAAAELFLAREPLPVSHPAPPAAYTAVRPALAHLLQDRGLHRTLNIADPGYVPGDQPGLRHALPELTPDQFQALVSAGKYRETLAPNLGMLMRLPSLDGYDGGILPMRRHAALKDLMLEGIGAPEPEASPDGLEGEDLVIIRDRALSVPAAPLLGALNVKYVVADRLWDSWVDGVYHDRSTPLRFPAGSRGVVQDSGWPEGTALSVITYLEGATALEQGTDAVRITVTGGEGERISWDLRAGIETAESAPTGVTGHTAPPGAGPRRRDPTGSVYAARLELPRPDQLRRIEVEAVLPVGSFTLAGLALIDARTGLSYSPPLDPDFVRVHTADVKVYQNRRLLPRLTLVREAAVVSDPAEQLRAFAAMPPGRVVLSEPYPLPDGGTPAAADVVRSIVYAREEIDLEVDLVSPAYAVISDTFYPGWRAAVDGRPVDLLRANYLFRAVPVPAGSHRVTLWFESDSLKLGFGITLATGLALSGLLAVWGRRRAPGPET